MNYAAAFPDYPAAALPPIPDGFTDRSWVQEPCPSFMHEARGLVLWCDYPDAADREHEGPRFSIHQCALWSARGGWQFDDGMKVIISADEWVFIRDFLDDLECGADIREAASLARLRMNAMTKEDAAAFIAEEMAAPAPCPDMLAHCRDVLNA